MSTNAPARLAAPELPAHPKHPDLASEVEAYTYGGCHLLALAIALHARPAKPDSAFSLLVVTDPTQPWWTDPLDADNRIDSVVHVFALDGEAVWDIHGQHPAEDAGPCCKRLFGTMITEVHMLEPTELALYIDTGSQAERPLASFHAEEIEEAWRVAERRLGLERDTSLQREAAARRIVRQLAEPTFPESPAAACAAVEAAPC